MDNDNESDETKEQHLSRLGCLLHEHKDRFKDIFFSFFSISCRLKRNQMIRPKGEVIKVNIGSGLSVTSGWINIDASPYVFFSKWPQCINKILLTLGEFEAIYSPEEFCDILKNHYFIHHDVKYGIPLSSDSVNYIYSSHMLEHFFKDDAEKIIRDAYRVLKPNGIIRLCVPDLEIIISLYLKGDKERALNFFFSPSNFSIFARHLYLYDFSLLKQLLERSGFTKITRCSYRSGETPDIDLLDVKPDHTLYVEAYK